MGGTLNLLSFTDDHDVQVYNFSGTDIDTSDTSSSRYKSKHSFFVNTITLPRVCLCCLKYGWKNRSWDLDPATTNTESNFTISILTISNWLKSGMWGPQSVLFAIVILFKQFYITYEDNLYSNHLTTPSMQSVRLGRTEVLNI